MKEAEKERQAVVEWLRGLPWYVELSPKHMRAWKPKELADAIERGEHLSRIDSKLSEG